MKSTHLSNSIKAAVLVTALSCGASLRAVTNPDSQSLNGVAAGQSRLESVDFINSAQADTLRRAYVILALGDHDYDGHRLKAMHLVEAAAKDLGVDFSGDLKGHEKQKISDDDMRRASRLLTHLAGATEIKDHPRIVNELNQAVKEINLGLGVK